MLLRDNNLHELLTVFSAPAVAPAGISGSALGGAVGAALILKVARITARKLRPGPDHDEAEIVVSKVERLRNMLENIVDHDAEAYANLVHLKAARAKGAATDETVARAMKTATLIPGAMGRAAMICVNLADALASMAYVPALGDLGMGSWLCYAAVEASLIATRINVSEIADEDFTSKILSKLDFFDDRARTLERILTTIEERRTSNLRSL